MMNNKDDHLTGPRNRWEKIGTSVYRRGDTYVWREGRKWWRSTLPPFTFRLALRSVGMGPFGIWQQSSGPFRTFTEAKRGRHARN